MMIKKAHPKNHRLPLSTGNGGKPEPKKVIRVGSGSGSSSAQKVKATCKLKRADFGSGMQPSKPLVNSGNGTGTGGSIEDDVSGARVATMEHGNSKSMD